MLSSGLVLGLGDWGGALLGPDAVDCVVDLLLEASDQLAVGVDEGLLRLDLGDDGLLGFKGWVSHRQPSYGLHLRSIVPPGAFCTIMAATRLESGMGGDLPCTSAVSASA